MDPAAFHNSRQEPGHHAHSNRDQRHRPAKTRQNTITAADCDGTMKQSREPHVGIDVRSVRGEVPAGAQENRGK